MSNILCGLDILEDSEIINITAILETINSIKNDLGIKRTGKRILKFASYFTSIFKDADLKNTSEQEKLHSFLESRIHLLDSLSRDELTHKFKDALCDVLAISSDISNDALCIKLINNSCKLFKISLDEMPLYKAKKIFDKYFNFLKVNYSKFMFNASDYFSKYKTINKKLIDTLNRGFSIQRELVLSKSYIESNGIENAISELLAFITFLLASFSLDRIYPKLSEFKVPYDEEFEKNFNELLLEIKNSNIHIMANNQKIISLKHDLRGFSLKINREEKKKNDCVDKLNKLKLNKEKLCRDIEKLEHELETEKNNAQIKCNEISDLDENLKMNIDSQIFKLEKRLNMLKNKLKNINNEGLYGAKSLDHITSELKIINNKMKDTNTLLKDMELKSNAFIESVKADKINFENKAKERVNIIKHRWAETFKQFTIKDEVYNILLNFNSSELYKVEMALLEMSKMDDVSAVSVGKIDKFYDYVILNTSKREPIKIFFEVSPFGSLMKIEKIQKDLLII